MPTTQEYMDLQNYHDGKMKEVRKIVNRFKLFGTYTQHDYDCAMGDLAEIVGQ